MSVVSGLVLYAVFWFMGLLIALPIGLRTHGDMGTDTDDVTPASSPVNANVKRKMLWVTVLAFLVWAPVALVIVSGWISVEDIDIWGRMKP